MAASMASSSTISARDSLMMRTPSFILENALASSIWNVWSVYGTLMLI